MSRSFVLLATAVLPAQSVVVPNSHATTSSPLVINNPLRESNMPRTYMMGIRASELTGIPIGALINGVSMRAGHALPNPASWPPAEVTWNQYEVTIGRTIPTPNWSANIAANWVGTPVVARTGPMVVQANTYAAVNALPAANPWGEFYFDFQVPFHYLGGDVGILFTHPGSTASSSIWVEQVDANVAAHGTAMSDTTYRAVNATSTNYAFCVIRLHYGYGSETGCPGTGGRSPNLVQSGNVTGGGTIHMTVGGALPGTVGLFVLGLGRSTLSLPNGCYLLTPPVATLVTVCDSRGRSRLTVTVPPAVIGGFNAQVLVLDPGAPGGFTATNGVEPQAN